jgi:hypothetical protein
MWSAAMYVNQTRRPGQVIVILAILLLGIVAFVAISLDGGLLLDQRRKAQAVADAAALGGACDRFYFYMSGDEQKPNHTTVIAEANAKRIAALHGYSPFEAGDPRSSAIAHCPPESGIYKDNPDFVEVIIQFNQPRGFSTIFGSGDLPVRARAVAGVRRFPINAGAIILDRTSKGALSAKGNGDVTFQGGGVIVNSSSASGGLTTGNGSVIANGGFSFSGTPGYSGNFTGGTIASGQQATPDPLAYITQPNSHSAPTVPLNLPERSPVKYSGAADLVLSPGVYKGGISITGKGNVTLQEGIYYMDGGGFSMTGQGALNGQNVMIYNDPHKSSDVIDISGQGEIHLNDQIPGGKGFTLPGYPEWNGLTIFQRRDATTDVNITGNGKYNIQGTFYVASGNLKIAGNGDSGIGSQYISYDLTTSGNGRLNVTTPSSPIYTYYLGLAE